MFKEKINLLKELLWQTLVFLSGGLHLSGHFLLRVVVLQASNE
jgi:hypothetical protein